MSGSSAMHLDLVITSNLFIVSRVYLNGMVLGYSVFILIRLNDDLWRNTNGILNEVNWFKISQCEPTASAYIEACRGRHCLSIH